MPNGDSLTIRHTPGTVPGGARPGWGLPYQRLPQGRLTPESMLEREIQTGRQAIQDKYAIQWKEVNRSRRFVGATKTSQMLRQIDMSAKQEMQAFNQRAQAQLTQLRNIDRLAQQGAITNPEEIKARVTFGTDVARSMYPTPEKERTIPQQFGELDVYSHRISQELERFQIVGERVPALLRRAGRVGWPIMLKEKQIQKLQIYDPTIPKKDPKPDEDIMGVWRKAEPEEITQYGMLIREEKDVAARKRELLGRPDISRRRVQPGVKGGTFSDKIAESIRPQRQVKRQPTATELRQRGTREAYEQGKKLGYWQ